jgi:hypothetical protein
MIHLALFLSPHLLGLWRLVYWFKEAGAGVELRDVLITALPMVSFLLARAGVVAPDIQDSVALRRVQQTPLLRSSEREDKGAQLLFLGILSVLSSHHQHNQEGMDKPPMSIFPLVFGISLLLEV